MLSHKKRSLVLRQKNFRVVKVTHHHLKADNSGTKKMFG